MSQFFCCACTDAADAGVVQNCGSYSRTVKPGCTMLMWPIETISAVSLKNMHHDVRTNTKTSDNVTVEVTCTVLYKVDPENVDTYYFKLWDPTGQIDAYVNDTIRSQIPTMSLDDAFMAKEQIAIEVKEQVSSHMKQFGVIITSVLMTNMQPEASVAAAMNRINAAKLDRVAALEKADAEKIMAVRAAEAEAEAKHLSGMGTAKMRHAITDGFKSSIQSMQESCGLEPREVVHMMLVTQYLDVLKEFAQSGKATMVIPHGPSAIGDIESQVRNGFMQARMMPPGASNSMK